MSCPHMGRDNMGSDVGCNPELVEKYTKAARSATKMAVIAKMTPNITNMIPSAMAAVRGGADGISAINTVKSIMDIDKDSVHYRTCCKRKICYIRNVRKSCKAYRTEIHQ